MTEPKILTEKELQTLIKEELEKIKNVSILVGDVKIEVMGVSKLNDLKKVEKCVNRLIKNNNDYLHKRKEDRIRGGYTPFG